MRRFAPVVASLAGSLTLAQGVPLVDQRPSVHVVGSASVTLAPDKVDMVLTVSSEADAIDQAMEINEAKMSALTKAARAADIARADLQLSSVNATTREEYDSDRRPKPVRYVVTKVMLLCLRNMSKLDGLLVDISRAKVLVSQIEFASEKLKTLEPGLQVKAVENARQRAEAIVAPLGARVGRPMRIRDASQGASRSMSAYAPSAGSSVGGTATGALALERSMEVDFELVDAAGK
jgi:uncharacterized protein YggE